MLTLRTSSLQRVTSITSYFSLHVGPIVADYLRSESFQSVVPEGVSLTNITTDDSNSSAKGLSTSCFVLVLIAAFLSAANILLL